MKQDVIFFIQSSGRYEMRRLKGVYAYAAKHGWHVMVIDREHQNLVIGKLVDFWKPIGCIAEGVLGVPGLMSKALNRLPLVFCDVGPKVHDDQRWARYACFVKHDSVATTKMALSELERLDLEHMAYVGAVERLYWSEERRMTFLEMVKGNFGVGHVFPARQSMHFVDVMEFQRQLKTWIANLPKPCGILAANDLMGEQVILACHDLEIDIPNQIALVGIDNDEFRCEHVVPTLSSVEPDFERAGYLSAELLHDLIEGKVLPGEYRYFGPSRIVRRQSSSVTKVKSAMIQRALEKIRLEACSGINAATVLAVMGCSRSKAERVFRQATGCSVQEKIEERRLEEAKRLLSNAEIKIDAIANFCGYKSGSFLRRRFRERFGMSMSEWRNRT